MQRWQAVAVLFLLVFLASSCLAQTGTSTIRGTVTDPSGRLVPNASVTLTNIATNAIRTTKSTDTGTYVFDLITPTKYRVEVDAPGFKKNVTENVEAFVGKPTEQNVSLEVGSAQEVVEVRDTSQGALVNTQDATLGNTFNSLQIAQLPLEARNVVDLLSLQPGATREGYVTGARADQSNVTLDGVDINNSQTALYGHAAWKQQPANWSAGYGPARHHHRPRASPQFRSCRRVPCHYSEWECQPGQVVRLTSESGYQVRNQQLAWGGI